MPGQTPRYQIPYAIPDDQVVDYPAASLNLANRLELLQESVGLLINPADLGTITPKSDGQRVHMVVDSAAGVVWDLAYRAASPNPQKWEFVGGPPLIGYDGASQTPPAGNWYQYNPTLYVPRPGLYRVRVLAGFVPPGNSLNYLGIWRTGDSAAPFYAQAYAMQNQEIQITMPWFVTAMGAGSAISIAVQTGLANAVSRARAMEILPVALQ